MDVLGRLVVPHLYGARQLHHIRHGVRLEQVVVVEMVEQDVQTTVCVFDLRSERAWCTTLDALHVRRQDLVNGRCVGGDM